MTAYIPINRCGIIYLTELQLKNIQAIPNFYPLEGKLQ